MLLITVVLVLWIWPAGLARAANADTIEAGRKLFVAHCAACHGANAGGGRGPSLSNGHWNHGSSNAAIIANIRNGIPGTQMPPFAVSQVDAESIVAFLRSLSPQSGHAVAESRKDTAQTVPLALNVPFSRLVKAEKEPQNWLTYWGNFQGYHFSNLKAILPANVGSLRAAWAFQFGGGNVETTPLVVDGYMFVTGPLNDAAALDASTGEVIWRYRRNLPEVKRECTVMTNRGFAILGDRLYMTTLDAHLVALEARTGKVIWDVPVEDYRKGFTMTQAPLAINGAIVVGVTAGECGLNGSISAYDATTGKRLWRTSAIAQPGDPARSTWQGQSAETGGGPTWMTGTYDAETGTLFWTTGNPSPDYDGSARQGDNLYTNSVLALDDKTGKMKWYFQFTPHDTHDWDANEAPVLAGRWKGATGAPRLIQANRNGFFYVLNRQTGKFQFAKAFVHQTWARGIDASGRPILAPQSESTPEGTRICPDALGGTNWAAPSFNAALQLFYVMVREGCAVYTAKPQPPIPGQPYVGTGQQASQLSLSPGAVRAIDPNTGEIRWNHNLPSGSYSAGLLATAGGVVFAGTREGFLIALDARTGQELWRFQTGAEIHSAPISYAIGGKQFIALASDSVLYSFRLP